jgi:Fe(3+) dicitrate transport protein
MKLLFLLFGFLIAVNSAFSQQYEKHIIGSDTIELSNKVYQKDGVVIEQTGRNPFGITNLKSVEGMGIYESKKTEVLKIQQLVANVATNNARQVFAKIAGVTVWENDGSGLQLNIGARGLSPNRTSNFTVRQNGYDISADALGYPESYYTPPLEAIDKIEVVRGASSLQYGPQFGGMINFVFKEGSEHKKIEATTRLTIGSFDFTNAFVSVGGTVGDVHYYSFFQQKQGNGWRPNSNFNSNTGYAAIHYTPINNMELKLEYTGLQYQAQQPGGLTDAMFQQDAQQSIRSRNYFSVDWQILSLLGMYTINSTTKVDFRLFSQFSSRKSLGNLERITMIDLGGNRTLLEDHYRNIGFESRFIHTYSLLSLPSTFLTGVRYYNGFTARKQGDASSNSNPEFSFLTPDNLENSDYRFPSRNYAVFAENVINLTEDISITPGARVEYIGTYSSGYYKQTVKDFAGNVIVSEKIDDQKSRERSFVLLGIGSSYRLTNQIEMYGNISQNYRSITFSDLRIVNPNFAVDTNIQDERGYNSDLGLRGSLGNYFTFDVSLYYLRYNQRIGWKMMADQAPLFLPYRYRTNIGESVSKGIELFAEYDIWKAISNQQTDKSISLFCNYSFTDARYLESQDKAISNKYVEYVPRQMLRNGLTFKTNSFSIGAITSYVSEQYSDATNAEWSSTAVNGKIPSYFVVDLSTSYSFESFRIEGSINNILDNRYFTRRAEGYPGPGIIPAEPRSMFVGVQYVF